MKLSCKVTDFIRLEEGNIGRKSAVVTGALLAASVLGSVLTRPVQARPCCYDDHTDTPHTDIPHSDTHYNLEPPYCTWCDPPDP